MKYFAVLCGALKGLMKALKAFIKFFEAPEEKQKQKFKSTLMQI